MASSFDWHKETLTLQTRINNSYKNTQNVRRFFKLHVGNDIHFSREFMQWMKENTGKTLQEAILTYQQQKKK